MQLKVRCPACQKGIRVAEGDAGGTALCRACGFRFEVAPAPLLGPADVVTSSSADPNAETKLGLLVPPLPPALEPLNRAGALDLIPPGVELIPLTAVMSAENPPAFVDGVMRVEAPPLSN